MADDKCQRAQSIDIIRSWRFQLALVADLSCIVGIFCPSVLARISLLSVGWSVCTVIYSLPHHLYVINIGNYHNQMITLICSMSFEWLFCRLPELTNTFGVLACVRLPAMRAFQQNVVIRVDDCVYGICVKHSLLIGINEHKKMCANKHKQIAIL